MSAPRDYGTSTRPPTYDGRADDRSERDPFSRHASGNDLVSRDVNHYEALSVPVDASASQVRQAYLDAARRHHPDFHLGADPATQAEHARQMQLANEAWAVLGDPVRRERFDLSLRLPTAPPTERIRPNRGPEPPAGKPWTPRRGDDGWQRNFSAWADDGDELADDEGSGARVGGVTAVAPVAVFALAVLSVFLGVVLSARPLVAVGTMGIVASAVLFFVLPVVTMTRGRHRD